MKRSCQTCEWARKAGADHYAACAFLFKKYELDHQKTMEDLQLDTLQTGWGYLRQGYNQTGEYGLAAGIMTNQVAVFPETFCCHYFEPERPY